jgi:hypothetical protein
MNYLLPQIIGLWQKYSNMLPLTYTSSKTNMPKRQDLIRNLFSIIFIFFLISSCSLIAKTFINSKFKNANVETTLSTLQFQIQNNFDTCNSFIIKADTSDAYYWIQQSIGGDFQIFDNVGNLLEYNGNKSCSGSIFHEFIKGDIDSFKIENSTYNLTNILKKSYDYTETTGDFNQIKKADFYVIAFWAKFSGGKFGYKSGVKFYEDELKKYTNRKILLIKLNTDLQEKWGMKKNGKAEVKVQVKRREVSINIGPLPWKD